MPFFAIILKKIDDLAKIEALSLHFQNEYTMTIYIGMAQYQVDVL